MADDVSAGAGNLYDKYGTRNPVARVLVARWRARLLDLVRRAAPASVLDVGCGEGVLTAEWAAALPGSHLLGIDVEDPGWPARPEFQVVEPVPPLPFGDGEFDLVCAVESLEHMTDPLGAMAEMARCARGHLLVSVPHEPLWRALNVARGAHLRRLGDTPGHLQHFAPRTLRALLARHGRIVAASSPPPWTVALVRR